MFEGIIDKALGKLDHKFTVEFSDTGIVEELYLIHLNMYITDENKDIKRIIIVEHECPHGTFGGWKSCMKCQAERGKE